jgi:glutaredoxin
MTKKDLTKKGIPFDEVDITEDHDALSFVLGLGYKQAPVVVIGEIHWSGFRPDMVKKFV